MNAEVADILSKNKSLADYYDSFINVDRDRLAKLLTNDILRELNYRKIDISDLPMSHTLPMRLLITLYLDGIIDRRYFIFHIRNILNEAH